MAMDLSMDGRPEEIRPQQGEWRQRPSLERIEICLQEAKGAKGDRFYREKIGDALELTFEDGKLSEEERATWVRIMGDYSYDAGRPWRGLFHQREAAQLKESAMKIAEAAGLRVSTHATAAWTCDEEFPKLVRAAALEVYETLPTVKISKEIARVSTAYLFPDNSGKPTGAPILLSAATYCDLITEARQAEVSRRYFDQLPPRTAQWGPRQ